eukprot:GFUD01000867.1.p2 GENE.GFUD01000867.1~~GFUD01000867.1.p2  ORF type:complete len:103 (-),score=33.72 GFUD01000867.1:87-395(-)
MSNILTLTGLTDWSGRMATSTMVGSASAYTKTQAGDGDMRGTHAWNQNTGMAANQRSGQGNGGNENMSDGSSTTSSTTTSSTTTSTKSYTMSTTFDQMLFWK